MESDDGASVIAGNSQGNIAAGIASCLMVGVLIAPWNGSIITVLRIPDLIATLSTFSSLQVSP